MFDFRLLNSICRVDISALVRSSLLWMRSCQEKQRRRQLRERAEALGIRKQHLEEHLEALEARMVRILRSTYL